VRRHPKPTVGVLSLGDNSVNLFARPWVDPEDIWEIKWDTLEAIKKRFDAAGISIPFPQRDMHLFLQKGDATNAFSKQLFRHHPAAQAEQLGSWAARGFNSGSGGYSTSSTEPSTPNSVASLPTRGRIMSTYVLPPRNRLHKGHAVSVSVKPESTSDDEHAEEDTGMSRSTSFFGRMFNNSKTKQ
jgi:Mechanosensitive ion channel MscS, C-terminal